MQIKLPCMAVLLASCLQAGCGHEDTDQNATAQWDASVWQPIQIRQLERGRQLYRQKCAACHLSSGQGQMTLGAPALKGSAVTTGAVNTHIAKVIQGANNGRMPAFGASLDDQSIADIISYERNAWGNHDARLVTAVQVKQSRQILIR